MKNSQKGFVNVLVVILVLAVIGIAGYYFVSQKENQPPTPTTQVSENSGQNDASSNRPQNEVNQLPVTSPQQQENPAPSSQPKPTQTTTSKPTPPVTNPTPPPTASPVSGKVTSCIEINKPGKYVLDQDIINPTGKSCITIHDTANVEIDCSNHSISADIGLHAISLNKVKDFTITSCVFKNKTIDPPQDAWSHVLLVSDSQNGTITKSTFGASTFGSISNSSLIKVIDNNIYSQFGISSSKQVLVQGNNFVFTPAGKQKGLGVQLSLANGSNNSVIGNTFDGGWDGVSRGIDSSIGADDSITIRDESGDTFQDNDMKNNWDCGIETVGFMFDSKIINNRIKNQGVCAIGGWYYSSVRGNLIKDNIGDDVPSLFYFYRAYALKPSEQYVYFKDNTFENNRLTNPKLGMGSSVGSRMVFNGGDVPLQNHILGNNIFRNNDFTKTTSPLRITPGTMIVDGGGNVCSGAEEEAKGGGDTIPFNCN